jgi:O-succinylbenzoate synthase
MRIERATLREIPLRLREYFEISSGGSQDRRVLLLTLEGDGLEGWSECVASNEPSYSYETTDTAWHVLTDFILPNVVGRDARDPEDVLSPVSWIRGHGMSKAAVEMAAWDLAARAEGVSLAEKLGGTRDAVRVGVSVGLKPDDGALHEQVAGFIEDGYARVKIKIKPGRDVEMLAGLRSAFPDVSFMADANSAYTLDDVERLKELDALDLMMIEQPLRYDDFLHHARLQSQIELTSSRRIHDLMRDAGLAVWCGGMLESGVGRAHNVALATLPGFTLPGDISASRRYWERDIVSPEFEVDNGEMRVPTGPGIGVDVDVERIESLTVRRAVFG